MVELMSVSDAIKFLIEQHGPGRCYVSLVFSDHTHYGCLWKFSDSLIPVVEIGDGENWKELAETEFIDPLKVVSINVLSCLHCRVGIPTDMVSSLYRPITTTKAHKRYH